MTRERKPHWTKTPDGVFVKLYNAMTNARCQAPWHPSDDYNHFRQCDDGHDVAKTALAALYVVVKAMFPGEEWPPKVTPVS
jgi:hypothetical protein